MATVFKALSKAGRQKQQQAYLAHLKSRDGLPDVYHCTLENREKVYAEYRANPMKYEGALPLAEFWDIHRSNLKTATKKTHPIALWMTILARINAGEKYGVDLGIRRYRTSKPDLEDPATYLEMEEFYHSHILGDSLEVLGAKVPLDLPTGVLKWFVALLATVPKMFSFPFILMAEVSAALVFVELWKSAKQFFGGKSEAGDRVVWLVEQILVDEVGHVAFCQSKLGPVRLWLARLMIPYVARSMMGNIRSIGLLYDTEDLVQRVKNFSFEDLPAEIRAKAFVPAEFRVETQSAAAVIA